MSLDNVLKVSVIAASVSLLVAVVYKAYANIQEEIESEEAKTEEARRNAEASVSQSRRQLAEEELRHQEEMARIQRRHDWNIRYNEVFIMLMDKFDKEIITFEDMLKWLEDFKRTAEGASV